MQMNEAARDTNNNRFVVSKTASYTQRKRKLKAKTKGSQPLRFQLYQESPQNI